MATPGATDARSTTLNISDVQAALAADGLDGWLLYDFRRQNPIAADVSGVSRQKGHLATRRWFYLIPAKGEPRGLVHKIEKFTLKHLPGTSRQYAGRDQLDAGLRDMLSGLRRIAMEYSPGAAIPYVSRVDAGTIELVRQYGVEIASSGDLVQRFSTVWDDATVAGHRTASDKLYRVKDQAFQAIAQRLRDGVATTEYDIQQLMVRWFEDEGLIADDAPNVSATENAGNPHYLPTAVRTRHIRPGDLVLIDLWGKLEAPGSVFADITWMGYVGSSIPDKYRRAFAAIRDARDTAVALVRDRIAAGRELRGWEVDRAASEVIHKAGYADGILHRTGHSLGESVHGNGVNMDDYETHDDRRLLPGSGFTIEPGVYYEDFGVRTEINMVVGAREATVTGPLQAEILELK